MFFPTRERGSKGGRDGELGGGEAPLLLSLGFLRFSVVFILIMLVLGLLVVVLVVLGVVLVVIGVTASHYWYYCLNSLAVRVPHNSSSEYVRFTH